MERMVSRWWARALPTGWSRLPTSRTFTRSSLRSRLCGTARRPGRRSRAAVPPGSRRVAALPPPSSPASGAAHACSRKPSTGSSMARKCLCSTSCSHRGHQFEQPPCAFGIVAQALRALDRLGNIRNDAVAPAAHLVAEEAQAAGCACADRASGDDAALAAFAPCRRLLDHESSLGHVYFERRVVEVGAVAVLQARRDRLEDEARSGGRSWRRRRAVANRGRCRWAEPTPPRQD
jgi:hypothetical protein